MLIIPTSSSVTSVHRHKQQRVVPLTGQLSTFLQYQANFHMRMYSTLAGGKVGNGSIRAGNARRETRHLGKRIVIHPNIALRGGTIVLISSVIASKTAVHHYISTLASRKTLIVAILTLTRAPTNEPLATWVIAHRQGYSVSTG